MTTTKTTKKITVYSTPTCTYCTYTKDYLTKKGVVFTDIDVSRNQVAAQEMIQKSGQMGVPVIDIEGEIVVGFQPELFDSMLMK